MKGREVTWDDWALGVLRGIHAPVTQVNIDTLWAWSGAESGSDRMRWNNPLNTTQPEGPGNVDANDVGVKIYPTVQQGIAATVTTLLNGRYPAIVGHLDASIPRGRWRDTACTQLGVWGTGCGWLLTDYGAAPHIGEEDMSPTDFKALVIVAYVAASGNRRTPESQAAIDGWAAQYNGTNGDQIISKIVNSAEFLLDRGKANAEDTEAPSGLPSGTKLNITGTATVV